MRYRCPFCGGSGGKNKDSHGYDYWISCGYCQGKGKLSEKLYQHMKKIGLINKDGTATKRWYIHRKYSSEIDGFKKWRLK